MAACSEDWCNKIHWNILYKALDWRSNPCLWASCWLTLEGLLTVASSRMRAVELYWSWTMWNFILIVVRSRQHGGDVFLINLIITSWKAGNWRSLLLRAFCLRLNHCDHVIYILLFYLSRSSPFELRYGMITLSNHPLNLRHVIMYCLAEWDHGGNRGGCGFSCWIAQLAFCPLKHL